uniref:Ypar17 n=1 Tax=Aquipseudomonas alcaligenes TaxID=43263 RepID=Q939F6_AQUAC|nr:Ypar17 [Pseudomonas alcaligenes]
MTSDVRTKRTKTALYHQAFWCAALLLASGSWLYQGYISRALIALAVTTLYFALAVTNYKLGNKLVWLCFAPAAGVMCVTAYPITSLWYHLYIGIVGQPFTTSIAGAIGIMSVNTAIAVVIPMLICIHLLRSRRHAL